MEAVDRFRRLWIGVLLMVIALVAQFRSLPPVLRNAVVSVQSNQLQQQALSSVAGVNTGSTGNKNGDSTSNFTSEAGTLMRDQASADANDEETNPDTLGDDRADEVDTSAKTTKISNVNVVQYKDLLFTRFGWFHPDQQLAIKTPRTLTLKNFTEAVLSHSLYNETAWDDLEQHPDPNRPVIAFLDIETCQEINWPRMGGDFELSSDMENGRASWLNGNKPNICKTVRQALQSLALTASPHSRLVVMSCGRPAPGNFAVFPDCAFKDRDPKVYSKLTVVHMTAHKDQIHPEHDFGIPPMPIRPVHLSDQELEDIRTCKAATNRTYFFSFHGRPRIPFPEYSTYFAPLHGKDGVHAVFNFNHYVKSKWSNSWGGKVLEGLDTKQQSSDTYYQILRDAIFAGCPRGDNLFAYRFAEILSAGTIPVVYADGWVLPYLKDVVDWEEVGILIAQKDVNQTMDILRSISPERICAMQQKALEVYHKYVKNSHGRLTGILESIGVRLESDAPIPFAAAPGRR